MNDENNPPVFAGIAYAENATTAVTTVVVMDGDAGQTLTLALSGADAGLFSISPAGVLTFNTAPDYENPKDTGSDNTYEVTITATDDGTPAKMAMQTLTITVTDVVNEGDNSTDHFVLKVTTTVANESFTFYTQDTNYDIDWDNNQTFEDTGVSGNQSHPFAVAGEHTIRCRKLNDVYINDRVDKARIYFHRTVGAPLAGMQT